jgi:predicted nucleic acid-binding protein
LTKLYLPAILGGNPNPGPDLIDIDMRISILWGKIQCFAEKKGKPMPAIDSLIAATGIAHDLTVVSRNVSDMEQSGVKLLNPWVD